jgi:hypothetical protein
MEAENAAYEKEADSSAASAAKAKGIILVLFINSAELIFILYIISK